MQTNDNNICIYHKSCNDGFGAALVVKKYMLEAGLNCEFMSAHYGDGAPDVTGKNVIIVDFSYPREVLIAMKEKAQSLVVLDHHKTAKENLDGLPFCYFDMGRSGAMMAWDYFFSNLVPPKLISHIQDRDLWQWKLEFTREVSAALNTMPFDFTSWLPYLDDKNISALVTKGSAITSYQDQLINNATDPAKIAFVDVRGYTVPIANTTVLISEICGKLAEGHPFAITYFDTPSKRIYSLRSTSDGVDVSEIARSYGGGGHENAAGFSIDIDQIQL